MDLDDFRKMFNSPEEEHDIDKLIRLQKLEEFANTEIRRNLIKKANSYFIEIEMFTDVFLENTEIDKDEKIKFIKNLAKIFLDLNNYEKLAFLKEVLHKIDSSINLV